MKTPVQFRLDVFDSVIGLHLQNKGCIITVLLKPHVILCVDGLQRTFCSVEC